jgi:hypothetical protein
MNPIMALLIAIFITLVLFVFAGFAAIGSSGVGADTYSLDSGTSGGYESIDTFNDGSEAGGPDPGASEVGYQDGGWGAG